jgi:hypothetical protein
MAVLQRGDLAGFHVTLRSRAGFGWRKLPLDMHLACGTSVDNLAILLVICYNKRKEKAPSVSPRIGFRPCSAVEQRRAGAGYAARRAELCRLQRSAGTGRAGVRCR